MKPIEIDTREIEIEQFLEDIKIGMQIAYFRGTKGDSEKEVFQDISSYVERLKGSIK